MILGLGILLLSFFAMEFVAWFAHKYLMHGFLWFLHKDHHQSEPGVFEKNDFFFLIFAIPSWLGIMLGLIYKHYEFVWMGAGIALYGLVYFLIHEVFIHRRLKFLKNIDSPYFTAIRKAHKVHHKYLEKKDGECFGMLFVPRKYFLDAKKYYLQKNKK